MVTATTEKKPIRWQTLWNVLVALFFAAIVIGIVGDYFIFKANIFGFKENGTLWNWLQLLSAPVFVTALPLIFKGPRAQAEHTAGDQQKQAETRFSEQQKQPDLQTTDNRQQETVMDAYLNRMSELLLENNLKASPPGSDVQEIAQAWTLTALRRVDKNQKGAVLQFLHEAGLIYKGQAIIDLREADLSGADLSKAKLNGTNLNEVDLSEAWLNGTNLSGADMRGANLSGADIRGANLRGALVTLEQLAKARSLQGVIMPDGSIHS